MANAPQTVVVDFSDVKESTGINPKHQEEGDYGMRIIKTELTKTKAGDPMALILFQDVNMRSAVYPYYCTFAANMLWKIRNTFIAAGVPVPKGKGKIDLNKLVNKEVGVTLEDDEYEGKPKSVISAVFHKDELEPTDGDEEDFETEEDEEDEVEEEEAPVKAKKKRAPEPVEEEDDAEEDVEEEDEEEEPAPVKAPSKRTLARRAEKEAAAKAAAEAEEDDEDDEEEPAPVKKKRKPAPVDVDEDDDELDLDDI